MIKKDSDHWKHHGSETMDVVGTSPVIGNRTSKGPSIRCRLKVNGWLRHVDGYKGGMKQSADDAIKYPIHELSQVSMATREPMRQYSLPLLRQPLQGV